MPKVVDHDQYRQTLLGQCSELFAERGYAALTMRQIAQHLGVSTGTLYHYFPSKEVLFEQFVEDMAARDILQVSLELRLITSLEERVEAAFAFVERHQDYFFQHFLIFMDAYHHVQRHPDDTQVLEAIRRVGMGARQAVRDLFGIEDPQLCVWFISVIDGLILGRLYGSEHISFASQGRICAQMLSSYLAQLPSGEKIETTG